MTTPDNPRDSQLEASLVLITGMSGAGRKEAATVLEEMGWYVADNLPPELIMRMVELSFESDSPVERLAVVTDVRSRDFVGSLTDVLTSLHDSGRQPFVLYLDADDRTLIRRYGQLRRVHPLQGDETLQAGIDRERESMEGIRQRADVVIDTTGTSVHDLRRTLEGYFAAISDRREHITVQSFGFKHGTPRDIDLLLDARFLPNPYWEPELRDSSGLDAPVADFVLSRPEASDYLDGVVRLLSTALPGYRREGKHFITVAVGCTGGQHRSPALVEALAERLRGLSELDVRTMHRDLVRGVVMTEYTPEYTPEDPTEHIPERSDGHPLQKITSLGGGHGLFATLRAAREAADYVSAVVTVADDGGSSGRMRRELGSLPRGDLRMALAALVRDSPRGHLWETTLQHRFSGHGALAGHAVGNLVLTGLTEVMGSSIAALDELGRLLGVQGRVLPMSPEPLDLEAEVQGLGDDPREVNAVRGQVAVASTLGQVRRVRLIPQNPEASPEAVEAILDADMVTLGPGSWFSSVIPHLLMPGIVEALQETTATRVVIMNLVAEPGETSGFSMERHIHMLLQHCPSLRMDVVVVDTSTLLPGNERRHLERAAERLGAEVVYRNVRQDDDRGRWTDRHSSEKLADVLRELATWEAVGSTGSTSGLEEGSGSHSGTDS